MSKTRAVELLSIGDQLVTEKAPLNALCQEIAENVYPERADFTTIRYLGENFSDNLMDSFPQLARRELGNAMSAIQRPRGKPWFSASTRNESLDNDPEIARFLEYITSVTRENMYDPRTDFVGATKMVDHDYVTFGQGIMTVEEAPNRQHLFNRSFHFKDVVWLDNDYNKIDHVHRRDQMTARTMARRFGRKALPDAVKQALERRPGDKFNVRCIVLPSDEYDLIQSSGNGAGDGPGGMRKGKCPYVVIYVDSDHERILKEGPLKVFPYVIPRWHRISGFQYAFSPAAMTSLPDSRMMQMMSRIIAEAGEKAVDPPILALEERIREANLGAGMITWVDAEYDGKVQDAATPFHLQSDMSVGFEMRKDIREMMSRAWFLDKIALPPESTGRRTAYEVARIIEDHVRNLLPLFEPTEIEYSTKALDTTFDQLNNMQAYDWSLMPARLRGKDIFWNFKNPMQESSERILVEQYGEVMQLIKVAQEFGLQTPPVKIDVALKDAVRGTGAPATWRKTAQEEQQDAQEAAKRQQLAGMAQEMSMAGDVANKVGQGAASLQQAGLIPVGPHGVPQGQQLPSKGVPSAPAKRGVGGSPAVPTPQLAPRQQAPALPTLNPTAAGQLPAS